MDKPPLGKGGLNCPLKTINKTNKLLLQFMSQLLAVTKLIADLVTKISLNLIV